jgi:hypothetical protein
MSASLDLETESELLEKNSTITAVSLFGRTDSGFLAERLSQTVAC